MSYVSIHEEIGNTKSRESLGFPIKKLTTARQDAMQVSMENALFQVNTVETMATIIKIGSHTIPFLLRGSRFTKISSLRAAMTQTTAPE